MRCVAIGSLASCCFMLWTCGAGLTAAVQPSFDCAKASTAIEKLICQNQELAQSDQELARAYRETLARNPSHRDGIAWAERQWVRYRDRACSGNGISVAEQTKCLQEVYRKRLLALSDSASRQIDSWLINEAILYVVDDPKTSEKIFRGYPNSLKAKAWLAVDLRLFSARPEEHQTEIAGLLAAVANPDADAGDDDKLPVDLTEYDGSVTGLGNYLVAVSSETTLPCGLFKKYPVLLDALGPQFGSSRDAFLPYADCQDSYHPALPASVDRLTEAVFAYDGGAFDRCTGTMRSMFAREFWLARLRREFFPGTVLTQVNQQTNQPYGWTNLDEVPLHHSWAYKGLWNWHAFLGVKELFTRAREDLAHYYALNLGLKPDEALHAAHNALWSDLDWAWDDTHAPEPLGQAILDNKEASVIADLLAHPPKPTDQKAERADADPALFLAVERPEILKLLLDNHEDANQTNGFGKTALMTAAQYDSVAATQLLIRAGADANLATYAPNQIKDNDPATPDKSWSGCGLYAIAHGSRTALMYAAANATLPVIRALLNAGADKSRKDSTGSSAWDYLVGTGPVPANPKLKGADLDEAKRLLSD